MATGTETETPESPEPAGPVDSGFKRFFTNQSRFDIVGRSRRWLIVSGVLVAICLLAVGVRGLNFGIEFTGGTQFVVTDVTEAFSDDELRDAVAAVEGVTDPVVQVVDGGEGALVSTPPVEGVGAESAILDQIEALTGSDRQDVEITVVGPRWGQQISERALEALGVFLVLVLAYISLRFEWRMAVAAIITLLHDIIVTIGVYALVGFPVSPASVIALLTILGYSLYDTVVIFDRVSDDAKVLSSVSNRTYGEAANESVNEVLLRSVSTSVTSLLPVGSLLLLGAQLLGADTLQDLALALFVGMAVGTYSSVFIAAPLLVWLKEKEPRYAELRQKVLARRGGAEAAAVAAAGGDGQNGGGADTAERKRKGGKRKRG